jgi:hypothetical protein
MQYKIFQLLKFLTTPIFKLCLARVNVSPHMSCYYSITQQCSILFHYWSLMHTEIVDWQSCFTIKNVTIATVPVHIEYHSSYCGSFSPLLSYRYTKYLHPSMSGPTYDAFKELIFLKDITMDTLCSDSKRLVSATLCV